MQKRPEAWAPRIGGDDWSGSRTCLETGGWMVMEPRTSYWEVLQLLAELNNLRDRQQVTARLEQSNAESQR